MDWFNQTAFSYKNSADANGHVDWVPLNLFDAGLFYNKDAFAKAGVTGPIQTWEDWRAASKKLHAAGYAPLAMDNSTIGLFWTWQSISNPLMAKYYDQWNSYDVSGKAGKNDTLTAKDYARAIKLGLLTPKLPEFVEALQLMKETFTQDVTQNWSGIKGNSGAGANLADFMAGRAAMVWGANFGASTVSGASFKVGSMGWPQITSATTPLSMNYPSQFGVAAGGTSYMIPSTTKGDQLKYAVDFLQFMTAPKYAQSWITATTAAPSVETVNAPDVISAFSAGDWGKAPRQSTLNTAQLTGSLQQDFTQTMQGYLLGSSNLAATQDALEAAWQRSVTQALNDNPSWKTEDWASK
jgi:multiple sugar transport system substrate-binding protein